MSLLDHVTSSTFGVDVMENWQSEYLQFFLYVFATVWLIQLGSAESKEAQKVGPEGDEDQKVGRCAREDSPAWVKAGGWRTASLSSSFNTRAGAPKLSSVWAGCWAVGCGVRRPPERGP